MIDKAKLKAVLIDFDGTLVDSMPFLYSVYQQFLKRFNIEGSREEFMELVGPTLPEVMKILNERYHLGKDPMKLFIDYQDALYMHYTQNIKLFAGARSFLSYAKELGFKLAIVTSATEKIAKGFLNSEGVDNCFDSIITAEGLNQGKPDPAIYRKALFQLGIAPDEAIAIEDSQNGVASAVKAGIYTLHLVDHDHPVEGIGKALVTEVKDWFEINDTFKAWYD